MPWDTSKEISKDINSENIFDEFTNSQDIKKELEKNEKSSDRDVYYYLSKISGFFLWINIVLFLTIITCFVYVYVQNQDDKREYSFLSPICWLFLWNESIYPGTCYGVSSVLSEYKNKLETLTSEQSNKIFPLLESRYSIENFNLSKKVSFLLEKWETRLKPLEILNEFDKMKNIFSPTDKSEISCYSINIINNVVTMTCDSYSSDWNTDILSVENNSLKAVSGGGTSISKASSFIDFFERYSASNFEVLQKPESFTSEVFQSGPYTQKTSFEFSLLYLNNSSAEIN